MEGLDNEDEKKQTEEQKVDQQLKEFDGKRHGCSDDCLPSSVLRKAWIARKSDTLSAKRAQEILEEKNDYKKFYEQ
eukprot:2039198-Heterocapsa_arctica.AAC.1